MKDTQIFSAVCRESDVTLTDYGNGTLCLAVDSEDGFASLTREDITRLIIALCSWRDDS